MGLIFFSACVAGYQSVTKLIHGSEVSNVGWVADGVRKPHSEFANSIMIPGESYGHARP